MQSNPSERNSFASPSLPHSPWWVSSVILATIGAGAFTYMALFFLISGITGAGYRSWIAAVVLGGVAVFYWWAVRHLRYGAKASRIILVFLDGLALVSILLTIFIMVTIVFRF